MTVQEIIEHLGARVVSPGNMQRTLSRATVGDLLSFVMGNCPEEAAWITIQTHVNVAAVAVLKDVPLIVLASGRPASGELAERCRQEDIALIESGLSSFDLSGKLFELGLRG